jgi:hypothetical protein
MGLYAEVIAVKSQKRFYIDRMYNISNFQVPAETDTEAHWALYQAAQDQSYGLSKTQMACLALAARRSWEIESANDTTVSGRIALMDKLLEQIRLAPDGEMFVLLPDTDWNGHLKYKGFQEVDLCT